MCDLWWKRGQRYNNSEVNDKEGLYVEPINIITLAKAERKVEDGLQYGNGVDSGDKSDRGGVDQGCEESGRYELKDEGFRGSGGADEGNAAEAGQDGAND